jgi:hypothetical protein
MKIPRVRWSARAVLLVMAEKRNTSKELSKQMWEFKIPAIVWREEMADLQITVADDGCLRLPPKVVVIPPPRAHLPPDSELFGGSAA